MTSLAAGSISEGDLPHAGEAMTKLQPEGDHKVESAEVTCSNVTFSSQMYESHSERLEYIQSRFIFKLHSENAHFHFYK